MITPASKIRFSALVSGDESGNPLGLSRRLAWSMRRAVLNGQFPPGSRLPSTRMMSSEFGVSRNTVLEAYSQLLAEGYLEGRIGSGTFVSTTLPQDSLRVRAALRQTANRNASTTLSSRGARIANAHLSASGDELRAFNPGFPQLDPGLFAAWWRLAARRGRKASSTTLNYGDGAGYRPLREAIAYHIGAARGIQCTADQMIVTSGTQQAIALASRLLLDPGDLAWIEDPGYHGARAALVSAGARLAPIPIDDEGLDIESAIERAPGARLVYVTPSHQYPLGVTMSLARRLRLLDWLSRTGAWVLEDDYDSEFRHGDVPLPTLQSLDTSAHVLYIGTFSKVLFPAIRLGYLVVPSDLAPAFRQAQVVLGNRMATADQATLAEFIVEGHFIRHVRRMRRRYEELRSVLESAIEHRIGRFVTITGANVGLHVVGRLAEGMDDRDVSRRAAAAAVDAPPLSNYYMGPAALSGVVLGYGHLDRASICTGVDRLAVAIQNARSGQTRPATRTERR